MPPPTLIPSQEIKSSPMQEIINLTDDDDEIEYKTCPEQIKKSFTQVSILSQKINSTRTQITFDLTDDDDDDFIQPTSSYSSQPWKKLKST
jgi:cell fate regulator YaaT (PSP1 superfamily)